MIDKPEPAAARPGGDTDWQRDVIEKLASSALVEQRRARRWGIFFKLLGFGYLAVVLFMGFRHAAEVTETVADEHTALVRFDGPISTADVSADYLNGALKNAFKAPSSKAVVMLINSPGGSPVQAARVYDEAKRQRALYPDKPFYVVIEDVAASGGYFVAASADEIYANRASLVGSIGVLMDGFGFVGAMEKLGVERRLMTAGDNKGFLDPFSPAEPAQREVVDQMLGNIHQQFISAVKGGRGDKLQEDSTVFSGLVWTGEQALEKGLIDGFGDLDYVAREVVKAEQVIDYSPQQSVLEQFAQNLGVAIGSQLGPRFDANSINPYRLQ